MFLIQFTYQRKVSGGYATVLSNFPDKRSYVGLFLELLIICFLI